MLLWTILDIFLHNVVMNRLRYNVVMYNVVMDRFSVILNRIIYIFHY